MFFHSHFKDLNIDIDVIEWKESGLNQTYGYDIGNGTFNGMIGALQRNEADIAVQVKRK